MRPAVIPFFSDELFRWCCWDESGVSDGWERKIKYNVKEYEQLVGRVEEIVERLQVRAVDVEKVAWVLGRAGADMDIGGKEEEAEQAKSKDDGGFKDKKLVNEKPDKETAKKQSEDAKEIVFEQASTKRTKRKARASISPVEGVRKSTRLKK
ncbi:uncharacterized protein K460DRAFT_360760 [Cucurbitaria berberidis CBS 394.84]|uniref:Uncharacterized protein n=1 Tax=Cucurbitaria berberidis CBS 394.84 TaxID=1168544 RepID=A0A9P4GNU3_9PLEO|nr:uncharacterized protein K460DRAFT_360760 [Cucurbitaria berberidis CBS 394.84]KAF1849913.1 hypothetical protein K460DRAFT_360760 [Cucurbitaria berberidis CBS 394.84]